MTNEMDKNNAAFQIYYYSVNYFKTEHFCGNIEWTV